MSCKNALYGKLLPALAAGLLVLASAAVPAQAPSELGELTGRVIWVDFWASWCAPCRRSFPWLNAMQAKYGSRGLQIVGVNVDKEHSLAAEFLEETPADFPISYDPAGSLAERFDVLAMPSSFLIDRDGKVLARHSGFRLANTEDYERSIRAALEIPE